MIIAEDELKLLKLCSPRVVIQSGKSFFGEVRADPSQDAAARCVSKRWLRFVRDDEPMQSVYEITPEGHAVLRSATQYEKS